ncbi:MAG: sulfatase-like hydrolase/transferase [Verrucomicrobiota bacterium]
MTHLKKIVALLLISGVCFSSVQAKPNIVFILADDMGYADLSSYGAPDVKTQNIDRLAAEGVRFTNFYANGPECSPSRTAFLTGRYPQRVGGLECAIGTGNVGRYDDAIRLAGKSDLGLPVDLAVLAPTLKKAGYRNAIFGKWHMGYESKFNPLDQGFDEFVGFLGGNVDYFHHVELSDLPVYYSGRKAIKREGFTTHLITDDAIDFLNRQKAKTDEPFFLYVPHAAPHFPFQAPDGPTQLPSKEQWTLGSRATYVKMLVDLDEQVGRLLKALEDNQQAENTLVVFASDHGAMKPGLNTPWRDYKGTLFEGGIRVPCIARWPGEIKAGQVSNQVATIMGLTRSFMSLAEGKLAPAMESDGIDIIDHVRQGKKDEMRTLFWRSRRGDRTWWAVRDGDLKYVKKTEAGKSEEWLFDLAEDGGEKENLLDRATGKAAAAVLRRKLIKWEVKVKPVR